MFKTLLVNPITLWLKWVISKNIICRNNKTLTVGYMSKIVNCTFGRENKIYEKSKLVNVKLGDFSYIGGNSRVQNTSIGNFCSIAADCRIGLGIHPPNLVSTHPAFYAPKKEWSIIPNIKMNIIEYEDITIGHDVWLGNGVTVLDGVRIGNGAIVATGAVVTEDLPAYSISGGVPAKIIKYRFDEYTRKELEQIEWWNWDYSKLCDSNDLFLSVLNFLKEQKICEV